MYRYIHAENFFAHIYTKMAGDVEMHVWMEKYGQRDGDIERTRQRERGREMDGCRYVL